MVVASLAAAAQGDRFLGPHPAAEGAGPGAARGGRHGVWADRRRGRAVGARPGIAIAIGGGAIFVRPLWKSFVRGSLYKTNWG